MDKRKVLRDLIKEIGKSGIGTHSLPTRHHLITILIKIEKGDYLVEHKDIPPLTLVKIDVE